MKESNIRLIARVSLFIIFYLGISLAEWSVLIFTWHVYSRLILFYCIWLSYTINFELPKSE